MFSPCRQSLRPYWWAYAFYLANFPVLPNAFFSAVLGHTWSLATEEQFYLVWPAVIRRVKIETLIRICLWCIGISIVTRLAIPHLIHSVTYARYWFAYAPLSRTDGLFVGATVAALAELSPHWLDRFSARIGIIGAVLVVAVAALGGLSFSKMSPLMAAVGLPAVAVAFGALVWAGAKAEGQLGRIFRASFLRRVGRISYALYLAHFPMLAIADSFPLESRTARYGMHVAATIVAYLLAELSWRVLERPINSLKDRFA